ncbi:TetR/AcrR family transcriptional regulator C-terminal domain-containing protein [Streptomyces sp. NPDC047000]|uniref:TetR/AcrR family transcriptional regulator C-terminal domain-containing protein n=1 Tax=Streptomyces sp. NPDC047000 TaxID=3155474 RepID=UPI0033F5066A
MAVGGTGRGRRLGLTREKVIAAALTMIDRDGPEAFSLRKLAAALDVEVMSLYNHVPNKEALLDGVAESLLAGIDFSGAADGTWQERVRAHAAAFRAAAGRHPGAFRLVCTRPTRSPAAPEAVASALRALSGLGLPARESVHVLRAYAAFVIGALLREQGGIPAAGTADPGRVRRRIDELAAHGDPVLTATAPHLAVADDDTEFRYGVELLISGLAARCGLPYDGGPATNR